MGRTEHIQTYFKRNSRSPTQIFQLLITDIISLVVERTIGNVRDPLLRRFTRLEPRDEHFGNGHHTIFHLLTVASNVVNLSNLTIFQNCLKGYRGVVRMKESSNTRSVSLNRDLFVLTKKFYELGNEFLGILIWTVHVVASCDDDWHFKTVNVGPDNIGDGKIFQSKRQEEKRMARTAQ